jgi:hypothetical protein
MIVAVDYWAGFLTSNGTQTSTYQQTIEGRQKDNATKQAEAEEYQRQIEAKAAAELKKKQDEEAHRVALQKEADEKARIEKEKLAAEEAEKRAQKIREEQEIQKAIKDGGFPSESVYLDAKKLNILKYNEYVEELERQSKLERLACIGEVSKCKSEKEAIYNHLKIKDIGLGDFFNSKPPCKPSTSTYEDLMKKASFIRKECELGLFGDKLLIVFDFDEKNIVSITRKQYLEPDDGEPGKIVEAAVNFYKKQFGDPKIVDINNWLASYGNLYSISYNGNRANAEEKEHGVGFLIKGHLCIEDNACDRNRYVNYIEYRLVDKDALNNVIEDGKFRQRKLDEEKISKQTF